MVSCIFSYQAPVSAPRDFVKPLHPISDLELHPARTPNTKMLSFASVAILNVVWWPAPFALCCKDPGTLASSWGSEFLPHHLQPAAVKRGREAATALPHSHKAESTACFWNYIPYLYRLFLSLSSIFFTLYILLEFCFLTLCLCPLLPESPGLCESNPTGNFVLFPRGNVQAFFSKSALCMAAKIFHCRFIF